MKKFLLGTAALAALAVPATAADMGVRPRAVAYVPAFSWTGCHVGGLVGYGWGRNDGWATNGATTFVQNGFPNTRFAAGIPVTNGFSMDGFVGGGDVGCDYQFGAWVVGVEADWSNANIAGQAPVTPQLRAAAAALNININPTRFWESHEHWLATARARFG